MVQIVPIPNLPEIGPGDDLAGLIAQAARAAELDLQGSDILCVAQKVVSKAEGCLVALSDVTPGPEARRYADELGKDARKVEVVLGESARVLRAFKHPHQDEGTMICEHRLGFISANAGVDESNLGQDDAVLTLPRDPDGSARGLAEQLEGVFGGPIGIVITDTFGRPWRLGQVNVAIGLARVPATRVMEGEDDAWGRTLRVTEPAFADELAAAAGLVMGKADRVPVILLRDVDWAPVEMSSAADILRPQKEDQFQ
ncbi:MAG: coenzyme F420-0:L-glutamate ligase [Pseudomonadota bacterium]